MIPKSQQFSNISTTFYRHHPLRKTSAIFRIDHCGPLKAALNFALSFPHTHTDKQKIRETRLCSLAPTQKSFSPMPLKLIKTIILRHYNFPSAAGRGRRPPAGKTRKTFSTLKHRRGVEKHGVRTENR